MWADSTIQPELHVPIFSPAALVLLAAAGLRGPVTSFIPPPACRPQPPTRLPSPHSNGSKTRAIPGCPAFPQPQSVMESLAMDSSSRLSKTGNTIALRQQLSI